MMAEAERVPGASAIGSLGIALKAARQMKKRRTLVK
jgi:hypothetical protein